MKKLQFDNVPPQYTDRCALRAGYKKKENEVDTVGCCSLRFEHIRLEPPNIVHFDFFRK